MKRVLLIFAMMLATTCLPMQAQQVYDMVFESATRTVNNPMSDYTQIRIAQFKKTALTYLRQKAETADTLVNMRLLDYQAYYLQQFITFYLKQIIRYSGEQQKGMRQNVIRLFIKSSLDCPLWNDPDTEITQSYIGDTEELTPFSLDTDWQKAYEEVDFLIKQMPAQIP